MRSLLLAAMVTAGLTQGGLNGLASTSSILPRVDPIFQVGGHGSLQMGAAQSASMVQASGFLERLPAHLISGVTSTFVNGALSGGDPTILRNAAFGRGHGCSGHWRRCEHRRPDRGGCG